MAVSETVFSTIDDFPKTGSGFGVVRNPLTLYEGFTIPEYSRCIFINYTNSNDGALIAIISDKTYTAFRNNGKWQSGRILVTNTDLQVKRYDAPQPSTNNIFTYIDTWGCVIFKTGKVVTVRINFSGSMIANSGYNTIFTLPTDYRPIITILENYISPSSNNMEILINPNGQLQFFNHNEKIEHDWICRKTITYVVDN